MGMLVSIRYGLPALTLSGASLLLGSVKCYLLNW